MTFNRKWVLYSTKTGVIQNVGSLTEIPIVDDNVILNINATEEGEITIPAYELDEAQRLSWANFFKPWAKGIALIDNDKSWDAPGKIIFAGPIVKQSFSTKDEEIKLTAYGFFEHLKKISLPPTWTKTTSYAASTTVEAGEWGGVMVKLIQDAQNATGAPAGWSPIGTAQMGTYPSTAGTGKSVTYIHREQRSVAGIMEEIRDELSAKGNEFRFVPKFSSSAMTTIKFDLIVGTDAQPHIGFATNTVVDLSNETTNGWRVEDWNVDNDATMVFNKLVVSSSDGTDLNLQNEEVFTDPDTPSMVEVLEVGALLDDTKMTEQLTERIKNSLVGEKTPTLVITNDSDNQWMQYIGNKITVIPGAKSAGTGIVLRCVGIRFTDADTDMNVEVDLMRIAARYPKLPIDDERGGADYNESDLGGGGDASSDFYDGGDFPDLESGVDFDTLMEFDKIPSFEYNSTTFGTGGNFSGFSPTVGAFSNCFRTPFTDNYGSFDTAGRSQWFYRVAPNVTSSGATFTISMQRLDDNTVYTNRPIDRPITGAFRADYNFSSFYETSGNKLGESLPTSMIGTINTGQDLGRANPEDRHMLFIYSNFLYMISTRRQRYTFYSELVGTQTLGVLYDQKVYRFSINTSTGALSSPTKVMDKLVTDEIDYPGLWLVPRTSATAKEMPHQPVVIPGTTKVLIPNLTIEKERHLGSYNFGGSVFYDDYNVFDASTPDVFFNGMIPSMFELDMSFPATPELKISDIQTPRGLYFVPGNPTSGNRFAWRDDVAYKPSNVLAGRTGVDVITNDEKNQKLYLMIAGVGDSTLDQRYPKQREGSSWVTQGTPFVRWDGEETYEYDNFFPVDGDPLKKQRLQIYVFDYGNGATKWEKFGPQIPEDLIGDPLNDDVENSNSAYFVIPSDDGVFIPTARSLDNTSSSVSFIHIKSDSVTRKVPGVSSYRTGSGFFVLSDYRFARTFAANGESESYMFHSPIRVYQDTYIKYYDTYSNDSSWRGLGCVIRMVTNPYKAKPKSAYRGTIIDTEGKLYTFSKNSALPYFGVSGASGAETKTHSNLNVPRKVSDKQWLEASSSPNKTNTMAIDTDRKLFRWGNETNVVGGNIYVPTQVGTKNWNKVAVGDFVAAAIDSDMKLYSWGTYTANFYGHGNGTSSINTPTLVSSLSSINFVKVVAGRGFIIAIDEAKNMYGTGWMRGGPTSNGTAVSLGGASWVQIPGKWHDVDAGLNAFIAIEDVSRNIWVQGSKFNGAIGTGNSSATNSTGVTSVLTQPTGTTGVKFRKVGFISDQRSFAVVAGTNGVYQSANDTYLPFADNRFMKKPDEIYALSDGMGVLYGDYIASSDANLFQANISLPSTPIKYPLFGNFLQPYSDEGGEVSEDWYGTGENIGSRRTSGGTF